MQFIRKSLGAQALMAAVVIIGLYFGYSFAREVVQAERLTRMAAAAEEQNNRIAEENRTLERELQYYQSDEYAELRARTDLNLRKPDELVILPVMPKEEQPQIAAAQATPDASIAAVAPSDTAIDAATEADGRNWDRWISLFSTSLR